MCINLSNLISVTWIILLTDLCYCRFSYEGKGNWELVKPTEGTKFRRSHACLHSQAGNLVPITVSIIWQLVASCLASLSILMHFQNYSEIALLLLLYIIDFCKKITQVIESNTTNSLRIQWKNRKIDTLTIEKTS